MVIWREDFPAFAEFKSVIDRFFEGLATYQDRLVSLIAPQFQVHRANKDRGSTGGVVYDFGVCQIGIGGGAGTGCSTEPTTHFSYVTLL